MTNIIGIRWNTDEARRLLASQTDPEHALWTELRAHYVFQVLKFRRQIPSVRTSWISRSHRMGKLIVRMLDSSQHLESTEYDSQRTAFLSRQGYRVVRFWNHEVLTGIEDVLERLKRILSGTIAEALARWAPKPLRPSEGETEAKSKRSVTRPWE